jgi:ABC-type molybdate transport system substrate-binding protein
LKQAGRYVEIPEALHPPIEQAAVVISASPRRTIAAQFIQFLKRSESARILQSFGFVRSGATVR